MESDFPLCEGGTQDGMSDFPQSEGGTQDGMSDEGHRME